jgi:hypothetical protein
MGKKSSDTPITVGSVGGFRTGNAAVGDPPKRTRYGTEKVETHYFNALLPFGLTTIRIVHGYKWTAKCGAIKMIGEGGDLEWIVEEFVKHVAAETKAAMDDVGNEKFGN